VNQQVHHAIFTSAISHGNERGGVLEQLLNGSGCLRIISDSLDVLLGVTQQIGVTRSMKLDELRMPGRPRNSVKRLDTVADDRQHAGADEARQDELIEVRREDSRCISALDEFAKAEMGPIDRSFGIADQTIEKITYIAWFMEIRGAARKMNLAKASTGNVGTIKKFKSSKIDPFPQFEVVLFISCQRVQNQRV
jgi:hypothetical protein